MESKKLSIVEHRKYAGFYIPVADGYLIINQDNVGLAKIKVGIVDGQNQKIKWRNDPSLNKRNEINLSYKSTNDYGTVKITAVAAPRQDFWFPNDGRMFEHVLKILQSRKLEFLGSSL